MAAKAYRSPRYGADHPEEWRFNEEEELINWNDWDGAVAGEGNQTLY